MKAVEKVRVRFIESIAGLKDPLPREVLDEKYAKIRFQMENPVDRKKPFREDEILATIERLRKDDRYAEAAYGFLRDYSFRPGEIFLIAKDIADKWIAGGICELAADQPAMAGR
jgi:hypothetical protein